MNTIDAIAQSNGWTEDHGAWTHRDPRRGTRIMAFNNKLTEVGAVWIVNHADKPDMFLEDVASWMFDGPEGGPAEDFVTAVTHAFATRIGM